ncbi:hypothetical protein BGX23_009880 [Mortierella sp. AD031]|nr:hypothetical protein BGX23_009880 [Mortierella sp. AD031]
MQRTRHVLDSVIRSSSSSSRHDPSLRLSRAPLQSSRAPGSVNVEPAEAPALVPSSFLFNKTWNIHKTTPFYNFDKHQWTQYEGELLTYIVANAKNLTSSALAAPTQSGAATIINRGGPFPGQIDSSGNNLVETMNDPGDIRGVEFHPLNMDDAVVDVDEERPDGMADSVVVTITVRPKGKTRDQPYYCVIVPDRRHCESSAAQAFTHFSVVLFKAPVMIVQLLSQWLERRRAKDTGSGILDGIEAHCTDSMKIDFSRLVLSRAGCSSWYIASEGKVKVFSDIATRYSLTDFIQAITVCGT